MSKYSSTDIVLAITSSREETSVAGATQPRIPPQATDVSSHMFGEKRLVDALNVDPEATPEVLLGNVRDAVDGFMKDAEQFDDLTMLCLEYK